MTFFFQKRYLGPVSILVNKMCFLTFKNSWHLFSFTFYTSWRWNWGCTNLNRFWVISFNSSHSIGFHKKFANIFSHLFFSVPKCCPSCDCFDWICVLWWSQSLGVERSDWGQSLSVSPEGLISLIAVRQQKCDEERQQRRVRSQSAEQIQDKQEKICGVKLVFTVQSQKAEETLLNWTETEWIWKESETQSHILSRARQRKENTQTVKKEDWRQICS